MDLEIQTKSFLRNSTKIFSQNQIRLNFTQCVTHTHIQNLFKQKIVFSLEKKCSFCSLMVISWPMLNWNPIKYVNARVWLLNGWCFVNFFFLLFFGSGDRWLCVWSNILIKVIELQKIFLIRSLWPLYNPYLNKLQLL